MLNKTPLLHQSSGPCVFLSLSLSEYFFGAQRPSEFTFLPRLLKPSREGALRLHPIERVPEASVNRASPMPGALLAFCVNQEVSAPFSPLFSYRWLWTTRFWSIKGPQQSGKIPHAAEQLSPFTSTLEPVFYSPVATATEPTCHDYWSYVP